MLRECGVRGRWVSEWDMRGVRDIDAHDLALASTGERATCRPKNVPAPVLGEMRRADADIALPVRIPLPGARTAFSPRAARSSAVRDTSYGAETVERSTPITNDARRVHISLRSLYEAVGAEYACSGVVAR